MARRLLVINATSFVNYYRKISSASANNDAEADLLGLKITY
ncbi:hypothetical protein [Paenibacillus antibioticophila]|nr:hypothetical protein [Paenibacillus antibioticophila]